MSKANIEFSTDEVDLLLRGLRFARSALMLDMHDPDPKVDTKRDSELAQIATLTERLSSAATELKNSDDS